jgi:signal transduction histidine kinase
VGAEALAEVRQRVALVDHWVTRVLEVNFAAGRRTDDELKVNQDLRSMNQLGVAITAAILVVLEVWRRGRLASEARALAQVRAEKEKAAAVRSEFFTNMSHELRTPLVSIGGFASMIETKSADPALKELGQRIGKVAKDLLGIINNILDVAKLESEHAQFLIEPVSIAEVLERCTSRAQGLVAGKPLKLEVSIEPGLPRVRGDFVKLNQVFTNLIGNAVKFTEKGSVVARASAAGAQVLVEIKDTGVGIDPRALETIWDRFRQADYKVSRKYGGSGLGLTIVRGVVTRLGGTVSVESTPGLGTTFSVRLPVDDTPPPADKDKGRMSLSPSPPSVRT